MKYNWNEIFKSKTDQELLKLFNGSEIKSFEARVCAGKILLERQYDKEKIRRIKDNLILQLDAEINDIENTDRERVRRKNTLSIILRSIILGLIYTFIIISFNNSSKTFLGINQNYYAYLMLLLFLLPIIRIKKINKRLIKELDDDLDEKRKMKTIIIEEIKI